MGDSLKSGSFMDSYPCNRVIANALFKTPYLESWGSGAQRIIDACTAQHLPEPTWSIVTGAVVDTESVAVIPVLPKN